jgi:hypothetical protein
VQIIKNPTCEWDFFCLLELNRALRYQPLKKMNQQHIGLLDVVCVGDRIPKERMRRAAMLIFEDTLRFI